MQKRVNTTEMKLFSYIVRRNTTTNLTSESNLFCNAISQVEKKYQVYN